MVNIDLGESLSSNKKQKLENLLKRHRDVFAYPGNDGYLVDAEHTIPLTTKTPIACRQRCLPTRWKAEVADEVKRLRRDEIIRPSISGYAAPICPVRKSDGSLPLCMEYRQLNG